jgi:acetyltransferase
MVNEALLNPKSIVVVGASNDIRKPGGKVLKNLIDGNYQGELRVSNPKEEIIQGIKCHKDLRDLPETDLAIMAIAAKYIPDTTRFLTEEKGTRAFIVLSAGFSEESSEGKHLEDELVEIVNSSNASLIGPNCIGVLTPEYHGVFTLPIPKLENKGCDFISGSGATACFIMEAGIPKGLTFARVFSVGNSAQMGVEEILKYMDETFDPKSSPRIKLLYIENIDKPGMLLEHASSLIKKGCKIAAVKAGASEAGSRAASSHTGALASPDVAVDALFRKAGIVRCYGREDLIAVASVFTYGKPAGNNMAVITHAGGPAVMLTDALSENGVKVPEIESPYKQELLDQLFPGSSVNNPIDFLATGTAKQLGTIIDYTEKYFDEIDAMAVIFGTPGLFEIHDVYKVLQEKIKSCKKPIYPILPSIITAKDEIETFIEMGRVFFPDEVQFGKALARTMSTPPPEAASARLPKVDRNIISSVISTAGNGYLQPEQVRALLDAAGIPRVGERVITDEPQLEEAIRETGFPLVMKVVGPVHKSDIGGVILNIQSEIEAGDSFSKLMKIKDSTGVLIQPMLNGIELFAGAKREDKFGHLILCGMGGIFIEVIKDVSYGISPISADEAGDMIKSLKSYQVLKGIRGQEGINIPDFQDLLQKLSALLEAAPEIAEMDLNPVMGNESGLFAVDARIRIEK